MEQSNAQRPPADAVGADLVRMKTEPPEHPFFSEQPRPHTQPMQHAPVSPLTEAGEVFNELLSYALVIIRSVFHVPLGRRTMGRYACLGPDRGLHTAQYLGPDAF